MATAERQPRTDFKIWSVNNPEREAIENAQRHDLVEWCRRWGADSWADLTSDFYGSFLFVGAPEAFDKDIDSLTDEEYLDLLTRVHLTVFAEVYKEIPPSRREEYMTSFPQPDYLIG